MTVNFSKYYKFILSSGICYHLICGHYCNLLKMWYNTSFTILFHTNEPLLHWAFNNSRFNFYILKEGKDTLYHLHFIPQQYIYLQLTASFCTISEPAIRYNIITKTVSLRYETEPFVYWYCIALSSLHFKACLKLWTFIQIWNIAFIKYWWEKIVNYM